MYSETSERSEFAVDLVLFVYLLSLVGACTLLRHLVEFVSQNIQTKAGLQTFSMLICFLKQVKLVGLTWFTSLHDSNFTSYPKGEVSSSGQLT